MQVDDAVAEAALVQQFQPHPEAIGQGPGSPTHHDRVEEQVALVDQAGPQGGRRQLRAADAQIAAGGRLPLPYRVRVEVPSIRVRALATVSRLREKTTLSAACQMPV